VCVTLGGERVWIELHYCKVGLLYGIGVGIRKGLERERDAKFGHFVGFFL